MNRLFHIIRPLLIASAVILNTITTFGQNLSFYSLTTNEGLSHVKVNDIYSDEYGMMWISTDYGLNRYDGHSVEVFLNEKGVSGSIPHDKVTRITGDRNGHIWMVCPNRLVELNLNTMKFQTIYEGEVFAVNFDEDGRRLYATVGHKILSMKPGETKLVETADMGVPTYIEDLAISGSCIYAGTPDYGVWKLDLSNNSQECLISSARMTRMYKDSKSAIWSGSWQNGLYRIGPDGKVTVFKKDKNVQGSISSNFVRCCCEDNTGKMWIGTNIGIECYDPQSGTFIHQYRQNEAYSKINHPSVWCMTKDTQGNIWLGSYFGGINWFNPEHKVYSMYKATNKEGKGLSSPIVGCMVEDKDGNLYIATEGGGLNHMDRNTGRIRWYNKKNSDLSSNNIQSLYYDQKKNILWIGTHMGGLNSLNISTGKIRVHRAGKEDTYPIAQDIIKDIVPYKDSLVLATHNGVYMFDPASGAHRKMFAAPEIEGIVKVIPEICIDSHENLWVSILNNGLICHNLKSGKMLWFCQPGPGLISDYNIESIIEGHDGKMYFGTTYSGLDIYDPETRTFQNVSSDNGILLSDHIFTLQRSVSSHNLLMSTPDGLSIFDPVARKCIHYNKNNGFPISDVNDNSILIASDSTVFIGSAHGMVAFKEGMQDLAKSPYSITLTRLIVNGKEVKPADESGILKNAIHATSSIKLRKRATLISIEVATSDYCSANKCDLEYNLKGFADEWNKLRNNTVTYTNLPAGRYTLTLRPASDSEDICTSKSIDIQIMPAWYMSWWAIALWILILLTIISVLLHFFNRSMKVKNTEKLNQSKLNLITNISHEIKTPLTVIIAQVESLIYGTEFTPSVYNKILAVYKNSVHLKGLISELLEFRKQEQGKSEIKVSPNNIVKLVSEFHLIFEEYAASRQITLTLEKENEHLQVWYDPAQIQKVFRNLISNAIKYTDAGGKVDMFIGTTSGNMVIFKIKDTGCGMSEKDRADLFTSFYRTSRAEDKGHEGTGLGLALTKGIIEQHHGTISVVSKLNEGTEFTVTLPLGYAHFRMEQIEKEALSDMEKPVKGLETNIQKEKKERTMLIVDDNDSIRDLLVEIFTPFYNILTAADGEQGWEIAQREIPDIVLSDVLMPKMSGTELCRRIKKEMTTCHIPVVLLTARVDIEQNIECIITGADDYIAKPFNIKLLISRCNNLVNSRIILQERYSQNPDTSTKMLATNQIDKAIIDKAITIIEEHLDNPEFNVNMFAHEMAMSRTNLFTKMMAITGQTPNDFVKTYRLKKAAYMLKNNPELSIAEIADRTGFNSVKYFSKCFNDVYHIRPAAYRDDQEN